MTTSNISASDPDIDVVAGTDSPQGRCAKQETFYVPLEQTPSERQRIQRTLYEAMAN